MTTPVDRRDVIAPPTITEVRDGLHRMLGDTFDGVWTSACAHVGVSAETTTITDDRFDALLTAVSEHDRLCHVLAMSWRIRRTAALKLAALGR